MNKFVSIFELLFVPPSSNFRLRPIQYLVLTPGNMAAFLALLQFAIRITAPILSFVEVIILSPLTSHHTSSTDSSGHKKLTTKKFFKEDVPS